MATFIFIHGSFHGAWCWERFTPLLSSQGHHVLAHDLPGSGKDQTPIEQAGLEAYANSIAEIIDGAQEQVILVGHSMGGIVASQAAALRPERIHAVAYICGLLLDDGETLGSFLQEHVNLGVEDLVLKNMQVAEDGKTADFPVSLAPEIFYNCCSQSDANWAAKQLGTQSTRVYSEPLKLGDAHLAPKHRYYVEALQDRAVSPLYQRAMTQRLPCNQVFTLDCDHSPFLSQPSELAAILAQIAKEVA